jgi:CheY-like chemotaxis protein
MVSANALKADAQKAFSAGCNLYMTKPIDINEFSSQVGFYLGREAQS